MTKIFHSLPLFTALLFSYIIAMADDGVGKIRVLSGQVTIERGTNRLVAALGVMVYKDDKIVTGADGTVGILLDDDSRLSLGPNSRVSLEKFDFNITSHDGDAQVFINKGTLSVIAGKLTRKNPKALRVRTPATILAVRGTEFSVQVEDEVVDKAGE